MSYILEALNKQSKPGQDQSSQQQPSFTQQVQTPLVIGARGQSISWGVLLTLAIFAGLFAGYWLGQNNSGQTNNNQQQQSQQQPQIISRENLPASDQRTSAQQPMAKETAAQENTSAPVVHIAAEQYFETPPQPGLLQKQQQRTDAENETIVFPAQKAKIEYSVVPTPGVSDDLLSRFQSAIQDTEQIQRRAEVAGSATAEGNTAGLNKPQSNDETNDNRTAKLRSLHNMPDWVQKAVPALQFDQHIYASDGQGWVRVNGQDKYEGDSITNGVVLSEILPQKVILTYRNESFTLPALATW
jgi:general secretion pathway protein A